MKKVIAIYPGSFDPPTNGHLDLIERGSKIFDELVVAILRNPDKNPLFSLGERRAMLEALTADFRKCTAWKRSDGLTVDYAARVKASAVLRGIRALSDYEYELQMAMMNRKLQPDLETVFMMPAEQYSYFSSRLVREVAKLESDSGSGSGNRRSAGCEKNLIRQSNCKMQENQEQENEHDSSYGSDPSSKTYRTNQPHRTLGHHGRRGGG